MPPVVVEARGLEIVPHGEYGVQPIWRRFTDAEPVAAIEYGPARLARDLAGPAIVVPAEQRINSLAFLQRNGAITSQEMELAIDRLLGKAQPVIEDEPKRKGAISGADVAGATPAKTRRLLFAYLATAVVLVLVLVGGGQLVGRLLFTKPSAANIVASPSPVQPSPSGGSSPTPSARLVNLRAVLIKPTDLRPGYVAGPYGTKPLCDQCLPEAYALSLVFKNAKLKRSILTAASVAPSTSDSKSVATALMASLSAPRSWVSVRGLGDQASSASIARPSQHQVAFYVVWRAGVITNEIALIGPAGTLNLQNAIDLAKIQQARVAKALR